MNGIGRSHTRARSSGFTTTLVVLAMVAAACGRGGASEPGAGESEGGTGRREFATFTSRMYPYSISYPATWQVRPATSPIDPDEFPFYDSPNVDRFGQSEDAILDEQQVLVSAAKVAEGTSLADWTDQAIKGALQFPLCERPESIKSIELAGEPAALMTICRGSDFFDTWVVAVHDGFGFYVLWLGPPTDERAQRALFDEVLRTLAFTA
jgi:hypothetical protein